MQPFDHPPKAPLSETEKRNDLFRNIERVGVSVLGREAVQEIYAALEKRRAARCVAQVETIDSTEDFPGKEELERERESETFRRQPPVDMEGMYLKKSTDPEKPHMTYKRYLWKPNAFGEAIHAGAKVGTIIHRILENESFEQAANVVWDGKTFTIDASGSSDKGVRETATMFLEALRFLLERHPQLLKEAHTELQKHIPMDGAPLDSPEDINSWDLSYRAALVTQMIKALYRPGKYPLDGKPVSDKDARELEALYQNGVIY